jgi:hemerythrin-like domain-containing protein
MNVKRAELKVMNKNIKPSTRSGRRLADPFMAGLRADHAQYSRILSLLSREVSQLSVATARTLPLLREAFQFVTLYLDAYHHPREDVLYDRLARRSKRSAAVLAKLQHEHRRGTLMSKRIFSEIHELTQSATESRLTSLGGDIDLFVDQSRDHIAREERLMYSQAMQILSDKDWRAIELAAPQTDPKIGLDHGGRRYPLLAEYFRSAAPRLVPGEATGMVERLGLERAGAVYGEFVGRTIEAIILAGRQNREALQLAYRSVRSLCILGSPQKYADAVRSTYRQDVGTLTRWTREWREQLGIEPV